MTYQLHLNISDGLEKDIRAFADAYGVSVSAAVRILLRQALAAEGAKVYLTPPGKIGEITR
jgi:plasmid stability protein